jgi:hypothetical protein
MWFVSGTHFSFTNNMPPTSAWYFITPDGTLRQWNGGSSSTASQDGTVVAMFPPAAGSPNGTDSPFWMDPTILINPITPQTAPAGVAASFPSSTSDVLQISGYKDFAGSFGVQVTVNGLPAGKNVQQFLVTSIDQAPTLATVTMQTVPHTSTLQVTLAGSDSDPNETLTYGGQVFLDPNSALAVASGANAEILALGLTSFTTFTGYAGKWLRSTTGANSANGGWYILLSNGALIQWDGSSASTGPTVAAFNPLLYTNIAQLLSPAVATGVTATPNGKVVTFGGFGGFASQTLFAVATVSDGVLTGYTPFSITVT